MPEATEVELINVVCNFLVDLVPFPSTIDIEAGEGVESSEKVTYPFPVLEPVEPL